MQILLQTMFHLTWKFLLFLLAYHFKIKQIKF